jgi:pimeloyl-ACP methyl ester carboxylesterase
MYKQKLTFYRLNKIQKKIGIITVFASSTFLFVACTNSNVSKNIDAGKLLSAQEFKGALTLRDASKNVQISYISTSFNGQPVTVNGLIAFPKTAPPKGGYPVLSWGSGTTGFAPQCTPSATVNPTRDAYLNEWLKRGYVVLQTDYEGWGGDTGHRPLLHGKSNASALTDIVTAAHHYSHQLSNQWIVVGHSEGGGAALWVAGLSDQVSEKYPLKGAIAIAPVGPGIKDFMDNALHGGVVHAQPFLSVTVLAANVIDPTIDLEKLLKAPMKPQVEKARSACLAPLFELKQLQPGAYLNASTDYDKVVNFLKKDQDPSALRMKVPVSIIQGSEDETTVTPSTTSKMVSSLCSQGAAVEYHQYSGETHRSVIPASQEDAFDFAKRVFSDQKTQNVCKD